MRKVDVKGGQMTFGQRIELGEIITDSTKSEFNKFKAVMLCLDSKWKITDLPKSIGYFEEVLLGIAYWVKREATELKYKRTADELVAGIEALSIQVSEMGTLMALAKDYGKDPDEILQWKYGKIFNILFTNLQMHLYRDRLEKRMADKAKNESRKGRMGKR